MTDDLRDDVFDGNETDDGISSQSGDAPAGSQSSSSTSDKRVNDLMSKWQTEEARANRLAEEVAALKAGTARGSDAQKGGGKDQKSGASDPDGWADFHRQMVRDQLFESDPRFKEYGLDPESISGTTPEEMKKSVARAKAFVDKVETTLRAKILTEHGLTPEVSTGSGNRAEAVDFARMSKDEFEKYVAEHSGY